MVNPILTTPIPLTPPPPPAASIPPSPPPSPPSPSLISLSNLFSQSFAVLKKRFWTLFLIAIIPSLLNIVLGALLSLINMDAIINQPQLLQDFQSGNFSAIFSEITPFIILSIVVSLIVGVLSLWSQLAIIYNILQLETPVDFFKAYSETKRFVLPYIGITLLMSFIIGGGIILFIIPGILLSIWFSLSQFVLVAENSYGLDALRKSRGYLRGYIGSFVAKSFVYGLTLGIPALILIAITGAIDSALNKANLEFFTYLTDFINISINTILGILSVIFGYLIFQSLRSIKGELVIQSGGGKKYIYLGILGLLATIAIPLMAFFVLSKISSNFGIDLNRSQGKSSVQQAAEVKTSPTPTPYFQYP